MPVIAFVEDVAASGGYMIACAADEIVCDASSIVGSIGVVGGSFGFAKLIEKIGIERRLYTSGEHKAMLDPFLPEKPEDVERLKAIQREIHEDFIALVKERRGASLTGPENDLFSGEFWTGRKAVELGLVDAHRRLAQRCCASATATRCATPLIAAERGLFGRTRAGRRAMRPAVRPAGLRRRHDLGAGSARAVVALRVVRQCRATGQDAADGDARCRRSSCRRW